MKQIRVEALEDILHDLGVELTKRQVEKIAEDFGYHIDMEREMASYGNSGYKAECDKCKSLEAKLRDTEKENEVFRNSVKTRRNADKVWIENDSVMYE